MYVSVGGCNSRRGCYYVLFSLRTEGKSLIILRRRRWVIYELRSNQSVADLYVELKRNQGGLFFNTFFFHLILKRAPDIFNLKSRTPQKCIGSLSKRKKNYSCKNAQLHIHSSFLIYIHLYSTNWICSFLLIRSLDFIRIENSRDSHLGIFLGGPQTDGK